VVGHERIRPAAMRKPAFRILACVPRAWMTPSSDTYSMTIKFLTT